MRYSGRMSASILVMCICGMMLVGAEAQANRPFMTDDGDIAEVGELEVMTWAEIDPGGAGESAALGMLFNVEMAMTVLRGVELTLGSGIGWGHDGAATVVNPTIEAKTLFVRAADDWRPGIAFSLGVHPPLGFGEAFAPGTTIYAMVPVTFEAPGEELAFHLNAGWVSAFDEGFQVGRPVAGAGLEWSPGGAEVALITEVFAGDPGDVGAGIPSDVVDGPFAAQVGLRWEATDSAVFDAGIIAESMQDWMAHLGATFVFDTPLGAGRPDSPALFEW